MVRDLVRMLQNHVRPPWEHAGVVCERVGASGDRANIVSKNEDFAAKLARVVSDLDSGHLRLVDVGQIRATIDRSLEATALEPAAERPDLESGLAYFFRLPLTDVIAFLAS